MEQRGGSAALAFSSCLLRAIALPARGLTRGSFGFPPAGVAIDGQTNVTGLKDSKTLHSGASAEIIPLVRAE